MSVMRFVGIDLGSSFIKGAVLDLDSLAITHVERTPFPEPVAGLAPGFREFQPAELVEATRALLDRLLRQAPDACGVVLCSQLHGLALTDSDGGARSRIINWQDQRALQPLPSGNGSYFDEINRRLTPEERRQLGNEARPGVPLCYLFWLAQNNLLPAAPVVAASLPNFVVANLCGGGPKSDVTNAFAHGALNVKTLDWHRPVIEKLGLEGLQWPQIVPQGVVIGEYRVGAQRLPVFAPVGDYQCSQVGAFLEEGELSVNISTGSAVIQLARGCDFGDYQTRPWFDGRFLKTITHIPGGRALNILVRLLSELAEAQGVKLRDPWDYILAEADRVQSTDLQVNPAFYFSVMGDHGAVLNAREENLTVGHLFSAAFDGMADNYAACAAGICPERDWSRLVFSGGVALKIAQLRQGICERLGQSHRLAASEEDTLLGLLVLGLAFSGRHPTEADAIAHARQSHAGGPSSERL
jgi:sugar (pentulose or hexulose) kinase